MREDLYGSTSLRILDLLRKCPGKTSSLQDLLQGQIPRDTFGLFVTSALGELVESGFITLTADSQDLDEEIRQVFDRKGSFLENNLDELLRDHEQNIQLTLTPKLAQIQDVLRVSLTELLEDSEGSSIRARPIFGAPAVFPSAEVFVLMPFEERFTPIYDDHIKPTCEGLKLDCKRADNLFGSRVIMQDVWQLIFSSRVLIADCSGRNPNVFYELGIAHTLGKRVILITQSETDIPFDIRHIRYIRYDYTPRGMQKFEETLSRFISEEITEGSRSGD